MKSNDIQSLCRPTSLILRKLNNWMVNNQLYIGKQCNWMEGHSDWIQCTLPIHRIQSIFQCQFQNYEHSRFPGVLLPRAASYSLPKDLEGVVDMVGSLKRLPTIRAPLKPKRATRQGSMVTPTRSRALWDVTVQGNPSNGNKQGIAQFLGQFMTPSDLTTFWSQFNLPSVNYSIVGPNDPSNPGDEASLDVQTITGVNQGTVTQFTVTPGLHDKQEPFLVWLLAIAGQKNAPWVHSVSYGDDEDSLDASYLTRVDQEFQKLGLAGHTFVYASGDSGVDCKSDGSRQSPDFPASSPHVVAVGGLVDLGTPTPRSWSGSGGGFSNFFQQPSFMSAAHQGYLKNPSNQVPPTSTFNQTGRGYPGELFFLLGFSFLLICLPRHRCGRYCHERCHCDARANLYCWWYLLWYVKEGCFSRNVLIFLSFFFSAAPAVSAILSLFNDIRIRQKKPLIGFVTPLLYSSQASQGYIKINSGPTNSAGSCQGFQPDVNGGWSPIVGFGGLSYSQWERILGTHQN